MISRSSFSALVLLAAACSASAPKFDRASSSLARDLSPSVPPGDLAQLVRDNTDFGLALYKATRGNGNAMVSPYSVSLALAMTYAGARGQTESEMAAALRFTLPQARLHPAFDALDLALASRGQNALAKDGKPFRLKIANASFGQSGFSFEQSYLDTLAVNYGAGLGLLDFFGAPEPSRRTINDWVAYQTEDRIKDLLPQGSITPDTRLVLANAVYFNAAWKAPFKAIETCTSDFHRLDNSTVSVPTMHGDPAVRYLKSAQVDAVELPYDGDEIAMLLVAPAPGQFTSFEDGLDAQAFDGLVGALQQGSVQLSLPKFKFESKAALSGALAALGMPSAFQESADFSGITKAAPLQLSEVFHQTFVAVDEAGTEAAAATGVVAGITSVGLGSEIRIDRPFLFFIRDLQTGALLFAGRVLDPA